MNKYFLHGKLTAKQGQGKALADILLSASKLVSAAKGCILYAVGLDENEVDTVFVTEIWDCKEDHDNSLKAEGVKELIVTAMPLLAAPPAKGQVLTIIGGAGL